MFSKDPQKKFWKWFEKNLKRFNEYDNNDPDGNLLDELSKQLKKIHENLAFEISNATNSSELVISADGIKEVFPIVEELVETAPNLAGWEITAFRQRVDLNQFSLQFGDQKLEAKNFYFTYQAIGGHIDLVLYIPGLTEENKQQCIHASYILLDMAIGEYDVMMKIRYLAHEPVPENPEVDGLLALTELPETFDRVYAQVQRQRVALAGSSLESIPDEGRWLMAEARREDLPMLIRIREDLKAFAGHPKLDRRMVMTWHFEDSETGMPSSDESDLMSVFEDTVIAALEHDKSAVLAIVYTWNGTREWHWYFSDIELLSERFNQAVLDLPQMPLELTGEDDPEWREFCSLFSNMVESEDEI